MIFSKNKIFQIGLLITIFLFGVLVYIKVSKVTIADLTKNKKLKKEYTNNNFLKLYSLNFLIENSKDKYSLGMLGNKKFDTTNIDKDYLFRNIDLSISQAKAGLKEGVFTTKQFLQYVLPYRLGYEKIENWRELAINNFKDCYDDDIFIHVRNINDKLKKQFKYTGRDISNRKLSEILEECRGGCYSMSDLAAFTMRASGIPVAIDFAKWSNIKGNHQWNSLITTSKNIPFMGIETNPSSNIKLSIITQGWKSFAKVYRKTFIRDKFKGVFNPKRLIRDVNYIDVTNEYCSNSQDLIINLPNENIDNILFYLCVYEVNEWIPVDFTFGKNRIIRFKNVCPNNVFILKKRAKNKFKYYKNPFTFNNDGEVSFLNSDIYISNELGLHFNNSNDRELIKLYGISLEYKEFLSRKSKILKENYTGKVVKDSLYLLYKWENEWTYLGKSTANDSIVIFNIISKNTLYKLESNNPTSNRNRCFTYDGKTQNFW